MQALIVAAAIMRNGLVVSMPRSARHHDILHAMSEGAGLDTCEAERLCRQTMAESRAEPASDETFEDPGARRLSDYGDDWHVIDCFDPDAFIEQHRIETPRRAWAASTHHIRGPSAMSRFMPKSDTETVERPAQHPVATILRSQGFVPLPRLWVRSEDMPTIHTIAGRYREEVNAVRAQMGTQVQAEHPAATVGREADPQSDPRTDKDAAWEAMERLRAHG